LTLPNDQLHWDSTTDVTIKSDIIVTSIRDHHSDVIGSYAGPGIRNVYSFGIVGTNRCSGGCSSATPGAVFFVIGAENINFLWVVTTTTIALNTWTTIEFKRISGTYSLYINGVSQTTSTYGSVDSNVIGNAAVPVTVGGNLDGLLRNLYVNGKLIGKNIISIINTIITIITIISLLVYYGNNWSKTSAPQGVWISIASDTSGNKLAAAQNGVGIFISTSGYLITITSSITSPSSTSTLCRRQDVDNDIST